MKKKMKQRNQMQFSIYNLFFYMHLSIRKKKGAAAAELWVCKKEKICKAVAV